MMITKAQIMNGIMRQDLNALCDLMMPLSVLELDAVQQGDVFCLENPIGKSGYAIEAEMYQVIAVKYSNLTCFSALRNRYWTLAMLKGSYPSGTIVEYETADSDYNLGSMHPLSEYSWIIFRTADIMPLSIKAPLTNTEVDSAMETVLELL